MKHFEARTHLMVLVRALESDMGAHEQEIEKLDTRRAKMAEDLKTMEANHKNLSDSVAALDAIDQREKTTQAKANG